MLRLSTRKVEQDAVGAHIPIWSRLQSGIVEADDLAMRARYAVHVSRLVLVSLGDLAMLESFEVVVVSLVCKIPSAGTARSWVCNGLGFLQRPNTICMQSRGEHP